MILIGDCHGLSRMKTCHTNPKPPIKNASNQKKFADVESHVQHFSLFLIADTFDFQIPNNFTDVIEEFQIVELS